MIETSHAIALLRVTGLARNLKPNELAAVADAAQLREVDTGAFFFEQGSAADEVFVLNRGRLKLSETTPQRHRVLLQFVGPGELFGATPFAEDQVHPVSAQTVRWCQAFVWSGKTMHELMISFPQIPINLLYAQSRRMRELQHCYRELATEPVGRRVAHALMRLATEAGWKTEAGLLIDMPLSHQDLAEMTGTTLYTVCRVLRAWKRHGLVDIGRQRVTILHAQGLSAIADDPGSRTEWPVCDAARN